ncbi:signal peptidase I [Microbacterium sp. ASV49]|uniref:Signal peptidase I n=1 Tax=Microbacterium candidum TaxID=3041922 RepID=A0ABT7MX39_9MICO|nr:signal peptidase I [Microbacterium sp. ASV49]MDL9978990.1 signal peptidase I [Microbacterium sp. ASV49]
MVTATRREAREAASERPSGARRASGALGSVALTLLAAGGLVCILLVILAFFFHITVVMFATGSMSPTIPAGSIALVREVPATQVHVGDVVTVDRSPELPITHRVIGIDGTRDGVVSFRMKGDANTAADPVEYRTSTVRTVLWSVPGLARAIVWLRNPLVLGAITLGAAALVTWAFWPREDRGRRTPERAREEES